MNQKPKRYSFVEPSPLKAAEEFQRKHREEQASGAPPAADAVPPGVPPPGEEPAAGIAPRMPPAPPPVSILPAAGAQPPAGAQPAPGTVPEATSVDWKKGELRLPNWIVFNFLPLLAFDERPVWEELYIWTHGFGENPRVVSQKKLCARLGIDDRRLTRILAKLEAKGYVKNLGGKISGEMHERGTLFDVRLPGVIGAPAPGVSPPAGAVRAAGRAPGAGTPPNMKEERKEEETSVYSIRMIAARLFEAHRHEQTFSHVRLRDLVREVLIGQGTAADEATIEEAIRGMAG